MRYIPLSKEDRETMLKAVGSESVEDLFSNIPQEIRAKESPAIPSAMSELQLRRTFGALAKRNTAIPSNGWRSYLGGGCYEHFIPAVVDAISSRGEFATAYTPYQPEVSQGTLQAIFEFQSMVANLFGLEVANASMYDGSSALAEAVMMALRIKRGKKVYLSLGIHPEYRKVVHTYLRDADIEFEELNLDQNGKTVLPTLDPKTVTVVVQQPNFYGVIEDLSSLSETTHQAGGLFVVGTTETMAFGILKGPGSDGADIVAGEGQSFGNPMSFGGPHVGLFAAKKDYVRQLPGRLVGKTVDEVGTPGYVLTLATREQHIRRERATSNICTNHSLCALRSCIYLATLGERGLREVSNLNASATHQLKTELLKFKGVKLLYQGPVFNEFALSLPVTSAQFLEHMKQEAILAGIPLSKWDARKKNDILINATETKTDVDLKHYIDVAGRIL